ncbi:MAG: hypothetical protein M3N19_12195 [Candidatus Eremiobacteraeota bacterium]|nr:hypothetical protein [Candidatus Eremiobacteraeota bacterium]
MSSLIARVVRGVKNDFKSARKLNTPWWGWLGFLVAGGLAAWVSIDGGYASAGRMTLFALLALGYAVFVKWTLRRYAWFWIAMVILTALQVPLIAFFARTTAQYSGPSIFVGLLGGIDYVVMLVILNVLEQFLKKPKLEKNR